MHIFPQNLSLFHTYLISPSSQTLGSNQSTRCPSVKTKPPFLSQTLNVSQHLSQIMQLILSNPSYLPMITPSQEEHKRLIGLQVNMCPKLVQKTEKDLHSKVVERFSSLSHQADKKPCCPDCHCQHSCDHKGNQSEDKVDTKDGRMERERYNPGP